ncbi:MAG: hypothetical protein M3R46_14725 [Actinomycetota bacterium]|nr:hypothetical protein [Actinomycetota bacterium]MDQ3371387.1 hypothetical protein [Actinomycetota bacterium]
MLFDLRARGRRRTIQVIYLSLAILMGGGLVLFGIGGEVQGGLFDAFSDDSEGGDVSEQIQEQLDAAEQRVAQNPQDAAALGELARVRFQAAEVDQATGAFTEEGMGQLRQSERAWDRYLALDPPEPDADVAAVMAQALGPDGLGELDKAVNALQIVAEEQQTAPIYAQLAALAYQSGDDRTGDLAREEALDLADSDEQREQITQAIETAQAQAALEAQQQQQQGGAGGAGGAAPPQPPPAPPGG